MKFLIMNERPSWKGQISQIIIGYLKEAENYKQKKGM